MSQQEGSSMDEMVLGNQKDAGDVAFESEQATSRSYVAQACLRIFFMLVSLYFFLVSLDLLGGGLQVLAGPDASSLFSVVDNNYPAALAVGVLVTVVVQSSSTTTAIIVTMVGFGLLNVQTAIPIVYGANLGTSVTASLVSLSFAGDADNYRRGFAAASMHGVFNLLAVALFFPLEWISDALNGGNGGVMFLLTEAAVSGFEECDESSGKNCDESWESPIKTITKAVTQQFIQPNKKVLEDYAFGVPSTELCGSVLCTDSGSAPTNCTAYTFNQARCSTSDFALFPCDSSNANTIAASKKAAFDFCISATEVNQTILDAAIAHFDASEPNKGGVLYPMQEGAGALCFAIGLLGMFASMYIMVKMLNKLFVGRAKTAVSKALNMNGYLAIVVGTVVTMFVQSSSVVTASLTPLAAVGALELESMLPLLLGANIGTTVTGVLASLVSDSVQGVQIALVHVFFNLFGAILFYPVPKIRALIIRVAWVLGDLSRIKAFPPLFTVGTFILAPAVILGLSLSFSVSIGLGLGLVLACSLLIAGTIYWLKFRGGSLLIEKFVERRWGTPTQVSTVEGHIESGTSL